MKGRILIVDDEVVVRNILSTALAMRYQVDAVSTGDEALQLLASGDPYAVIMADMMMPQMNGIELLAECEKRSPFTERILLTGDPTQQTAIVAVNVGHVFRFLAKPFDIEVLFEMVDAAVKHREVVLAEVALLDSTLRSSMNILLEIVSTAEPQSFELSQRLRRTVRTFALATKSPNAWELEMVAALARIGTATLPAVVLRRISGDMPLSELEQGLLANVPEIGWRLIKAIPRLESVAEAVRYQSKHFDGTGLPAGGSAGNRIPLGARILKIFTERALLEMDGVAKAQAKRQMESRTGEFDPVLLQKSFDVFPEYILQGVSAQVAVRMVPVTELHPNMTIVTDIRAKDGLKIVAAGTRLTAMAIQRIVNHVEMGTLAGPFCVQEALPEQMATVT